MEIFNLGMGRPCIFKYPPGYTLQAASPSEICVHLLDIQYTTQGIDYNIALTHTKQSWDSEKLQCKEASAASTLNNNYTNTIRYMSLTETISFANHIVQFSDI